MMDEYTIAFCIFPFLYGGFNVISFCINIIILGSQPLHIVDSHFIHRVFIVYSIFVVKKITIMRKQYFGVYGVQVYIW